MDTFPSLFLQHVGARKSDIAIRAKRLGLWNSYTWEEATTIVSHLACGLSGKIGPNENVAIVGNNIPELYFATIAVQCLGAVPVPIHPDANPVELAMYLNDCQAKLAIVQDQQQVDHIQDILDKLGDLKELIYHDGRGMQEYGDEHLTSFDEVISRGSEISASNPNFLQEIAAKITPKSTAFIIYTSGTSGQARGAVHTHNSLIDTAKVFSDSEKIKQNEELLAFMPLSYVANVFFTYTLWLLKGFTVNCPESNETVMTDLREIGPTILYAPPHFYKQLYAEIISRGQRSSTYWFEKWFTLARTNRERFLSGEDLSFGDKFMWILGDYLMYRPLKNVYGLTKLRKAFTGGDIMSSEVFNFLRSIGLHIKKIYGTTESAGIICVQGWEQLNASSGEFVSGRPLKDVEIKNTEGGEVAFRGINAFSEYYNNPKATTAAIDADGWIKTGDLGNIDALGALKITDRLDAIGKFSTGDVFAPHLIENALKSSPYIKDALAVGDGRESIAALVMIDSDTVGGWAETNSIRFTGYRDLATKEEVYGLVKTTISNVNKHIDQIGETGCPPIKRFLIMHREFNIEAGEITRSRKVKRDVVMDMHAALIDALYSPKKTYEVKDSSTGETLAELKLESA